MLFEMEGDTAENNFMNNLQNKHKKKLSALKADSFENIQIRKRLMIS